MNYLMFFLIKVFHKIVFWTRHPRLLNIRSNDLYHRFIYSKLVPYFTKVVNKINKNKISHNNNGPIWMFWWQGKKNMPLLVQRCVQSVLRNSGSHKVIIVTESNIKKYSTMPDYIYKKVKGGKITLTHLSDILRFNLLYNYGGLWIDSTMYCSGKLNSHYFSNLYTSGGYKDINKYHQFVSSKWTGFLIGGCKHNPLFKFMNEFFKLYWLKNNYQIDYFLIDYALFFAYLHNIGNFHIYVDNEACVNNPNLYDLVSHLNDDYNYNLYKRMVCNTQLFKLTYKQKFNSKTNTFYSKLINNKL